MTPCPQIEPDGSAHQSMLGEEETGLGRTQIELTNVELVQMQIRIIALENLVIALLAGAPEAVAELAREFAGCISPRSGHTPHHLTLHAASQMLHLTQRSELFRSRGDPSTSKSKSTSKPGIG